MDDLASYGDDLDDAAIKEHIERYTRAALVLRRRLNSRQPISSLPSEILVMIFHDAAHDAAFFTGDYYFDCFLVGRANLCAIARTCFRWNELIANTPLFWVDISMYMSTDVIETALERSRTLPINLHLFEETDEFEWPSEEDEFWEMVEPHLARCKRFLCDERTKSLEMARQYMPTLASLYVGEPGTGEPSCRTFYFQPLPGFAPMLEFLGISFASVSGATFLATLATCPILKSLYLYLVDFDLTDAPTLEEGAVSLLSLGSIHLNEVAGPELNMLVRSIRPGKCTSLKLVSSEGFGFSENPAWVSSCISQNVDDLARKSKDAEVIFKIQDYMVAFRGPQFDLVTDHPCDHATGAWIAKFFPSFPTSWTLRIEIETDSSDLIQLETLPYLKCGLRFTLTQQSHHREFIQWFWGSQPGDQTREIPCPRVESLKIRFDELAAVDYFLDTLSRHHSFSAAVPVIQNLCISLPQLRPDVCERARGILGHRRVYCVTVVRDRGLFNWPSDV